MNTPSPSAPTIIPPASAPGPDRPWLDRAARDFLFRLLGRLRQGRLTVVADGQVREFGAAAALVPAAALIRVHRSRFFRAVLFGGSRGLGESYLRGDWSSPDVTAVICLLLRTVRAWDSYFRLNRLLQVFWLPRRRRHRNTLTGSRKNIASHYDLGNDFYRLFLDASMTYSCAVFTPGAQDLAAAQAAKYDRICRKLDLQPADHLLEIGSGWGGFALHAAARCGCRVTTTTISPAQYHYARQAVRQAGLDGRVTVLCEDYRRLQGRFDKLASIEMIEAVGPEHLADFYRVCSQRLQPDGLMLLQAITIGDQDYHRYVRSLDFIRSHIFPGGCVVSLQALGTAAARTTDLRLVHLEDLTPFYPLTLRLWRQRFLAQRDAIRAQGYPEEFIRLWEFYLCYCEGGFLERYIGDVQVLYAKPLYRRPAWPFSLAPGLGDI